jgi:hypothetical protein
MRDRFLLLDAWASPFDIFIDFIFHEWLEEPLSSKVKYSFCPYIAYTLQVFQHCLSVLYKYDKLSSDLFFCTRVHLPGLTCSTHATVLMIPHTACLMAQDTI